MAKKTQRPRTARRASAQADRRAIERLENLATQLPGGAPAHPRTVASASVIEVLARATRCLLCDGELELQAHVAEEMDRENTRRVELVCKRCRGQRRLWFRIEPPSAN
ncbi:MAG TPA: hypothetical protein VGP07_22975 [Polyangia bacterium]|jgi:hypothetical protein